MLVLRCTQKLLKRHPGPADDGQDALAPTLGNWHANLIRLARWPVVVCVNDISLLVVLVPGRDFPNLVSAFRDRLVQRLRRLGLSEDKISIERAAMELVQIQPSNSKSILASMNDFVRNLKLQVGDRFEFTYADALEDLLSQAPMGSLEYRFSAEVASTFFKLPRKDWSYDLFQGPTWQ